MEYIGAYSMKRDESSAGRTAIDWERRQRATAFLDEQELQEIERTSPNGLTSRQIVDVFETRGIRFSEATLRKYVQLGLLPRSVRVGSRAERRLPWMDPSSMPGRVA